jgi:hypothetical protein
LEAREETCAMPNLDVRRFAIHSHQAASSRAQLIEGAGFEDAALRFVEDFHHAADSHDAVSLIVEDCGSGERRCFMVDIATGAAEPCS